MSETRHSIMGSAEGWGETKCKLPSLCERRMCHPICDCSATDVYWILFQERSEARKKKEQENIRWRKMRSNDAHRGQHSLYRSMFCELGSYKFCYCASLASSLLFVSNYCLLNARL